MVSLSIVVPVYNGEKFLKRCVDSILSQDFKDFELILVNDGSTDGSLGICHEYEQKDSRVVVLSKDNEGPYVARKSGVSVAKGQYIGFVDCDDYIDSNMYSIMMTAARQNNADIVASDIILENSNTVQIVHNKIPAGVYFKDDVKNVIIPKMIIHSGFVNYGIIPGVVVKIFKRDVLNAALKNLCNCDSIGEDLATVAYCMVRTKTLMIINNASYHYVQSDDSLMRKFDIGRIQKIQGLYNCLLNIQNEALKNQVDPYISFLVFNAVSECINKSGYDKIKMIKTIKEILNSDVAVKALENTKISSFLLENKLKIILMKHSFVRILILLLRR